MSIMGSSSSTQAERAGIPRGLFDAILCTALFYGVYAQTPIGAVGEFMVRAALGQEYAPSWYATFRGKEIHVETKNLTTFKEKGMDRAIPALVSQAAATQDVPLAVLFALVSTHGECQAQNCVMTAPPHVPQILDQFNGKETIHIDTAALALRHLQDLNGVFRQSNSALVSALYVGASPVEQAIEQAVISKVTSPMDIESFSPFLSPALRRGPLQNAVQVLAFQRLHALGWPVDSTFRISSPFGMRTHPVINKKALHNGVDIATPTGTPLRAPSRGLVSRIGNDSISGKYVKIDHGLGIETAYAHLDSVQIKKSDVLQEAQVFGETGKSGRVSGPHLHYIVRVDGTPIDPIQFKRAISLPTKEN